MLKPLMEFTKVEFKKTKKARELKGQLVPSLKGSSTFLIGSDYYIKDWRNSQLAVLLYRRKNMLETKELDQEVLAAELDEYATKIENAKNMVSFLAMAMNKDSELLDFPKSIESTLLILEEYIEWIPDELNNNAGLLIKEFSKNKKESEK